MPPPPPLLPSPFLLREAQTLLTPPPFPQVINVSYQNLECLLDQGIASADIQKVSGGKHILGVCVCDPSTAPL